MKKKTTSRRPSRTKTIDLRELTVRQYMALVAAPPMHTPTELADRSGVPRPKCSIFIGGTDIYPAGRAAIAAALAGEDGRPVDDELLDRLLENARAEG